MLNPRLFLSALFLAPALTLADTDENELRKLRDRIDSLEQEVSALHRQIPPPPPRPKSGEEPSLPPAPPPLAGYIPLFSSGSWIKIGISAQADVLTDSADLGAPKGMFVTSSINTRKQGSYQTSMSARQSSLTADAIQFTSAGPVHLRYANNFFNNDGTSTFGFNLLRLYAEWQGLRAGYGYSAFADEDAIPSTLDWASTNSLPITYTPQIRYTRPFLSNSKNRFYFFGSLEHAPPDTTGTTRSSSRTPDLILGTRLQQKSFHAQLALLARTITTETPAARDDKFAGGAGISTALSLPNSDYLSLWGQYGKGIASYIQDTEALGLDAVATGASTSLPKIYGIGAGYTRQWTPLLSSTLTYGYVNAGTSTYAALPPDTIAHTHYASANLVWKIAPFLSAGIEYLYGFKKARDGSSDDIKRIQLSVKYSFNQ